MSLSFLEGVLLAGDLQKTLASIASLSNSIPITVFGEASVIEALSSRAQKPGQDGFWLRSFPNGQMFRGLVGEPHPERISESLSPYFLVLSEGASLIVGAASRIISELETGVSLVTFDGYINNTPAFLEPFRLQYQGLPPAFAISREHLVGPTLKDSVNGAARLGLPRHIPEHLCRVNS